MKKLLMMFVLLVAGQNLLANASCKKTCLGLRGSQRSTCNIDCEQSR